MIKVKDLTLIYGNGTIALENVNLEIKPGEIVYMTGPSGSGKTSLLKLIMGMEYPSKGSLEVLGHEIRRQEASNIRKLRRKMGPVFQEFRLIKGRTVIENIILGMRFLNFSQQEIEQNADDALNKVGLAHKRDSLVEELSWGESQRIAIARAIARKPSLILADEPTGNLDLENATKILDILISLKDENTSVIIATHASHLIQDIQEGTFIQVDKGNVQVERRGGKVN